MKGVYKGEALRHTQKRRITESSGPEPLPGDKRSMDRTLPPRAYPGRLEDRTPTHLTREGGTFLS